MLWLAGTVYWGSKLSCAGYSLSCLVNPHLQHSRLWVRPNPTWATRIFSEIVFNSKKISYRSCPSHQTLFPKSECNCRRTWSPMRPGGVRKKAGNTGSCWLPARVLVGHTLRSGWPGRVGKVRVDQLPSLIHYNHDYCYPFNMFNKLVHV